MNEDKNTKNRSEQKQNETTDKEIVSKEDEQRIHIIHNGIPNAVIDFGDRGRSMLNKTIDVSSELHQQKLLDIEAKQKLFIDNEIRNLPERWQIRFDGSGYPCALINAWGDERVIPTAEEILVEHEKFLCASNMHIIENYVRHRYAELGLSEAQFTKKLGFRNFKKAQKRLKYLFDAQWQFTEEIIQLLPAALEVPVETVTHFVEQTKIDLRNRFEIERRKTFHPFAALITEKSRPSSITIAGLSGAFSYRNIDISDIEESQYIKYIVERMASRPNELRIVRGFFGEISGIAVNYTPDITVKFDLNGDFISTLDGNFYPSQCIMSFS